MPALIFEHGLERRLHDIMYMRALEVTGEMTVDPLFENLRQQKPLRQTLAGMPMARA